MPGRADANVDPAILLERRRAQNRLAQHKFRQKKLAAAKLKQQQQQQHSGPSAKASSGSSSSDSPASSTSSSSSAVFASNSVASSFSEREAWDAWLDSSSSKLHANNASMQIPPGLGANIPMSMNTSPYLNVLPVFAHSSTAESTAFNSSAPSSSTDSNSFSEVEVSSSGPQLIDGRTDCDGGDESSSGINDLSLQDATSFNGLEVIQSNKQQSDGVPNDQPLPFGYTQSSSESSPSPSSVKKSSASKQIDAQLSWEIAHTLTQEKGLLALILMQSGSPSLAALRAALFDPTADHRFAAKNPFAKAIYQNATTLGFLDNDLRANMGASTIDKVWPARSAPALLGLPWSVPSDAVTQSGEPSPWCIPASLSARCEQTRLARLRDSPNMYPTQLQMEKPHSILIDTLPWPSLRDAMIRMCLSGVTDGFQIKCDLIGKTHNCIGDGNTFVIHGDDPCDAESWEISEAFAIRYASVIDKSIIKRTNFWRRMRGLPNLDLGQQAPQNDWIVQALMNASSTLL